MADVAAQIGASLNALTREFDIAAHNMANVSTVGYKRRCNSFTQVLAGQKGGQGEEKGGSQGFYDFSQGHLVQTDRKLDFALYGEGFFVLETPDGPMYTRHGTFQTNQNGQIVDTAGRIVAGMAGPIIVPPNANVTELYTAEDGRVIAGNSVIGQFRIVNFPDDKDKLQAVGDSCFQLSKDVDPVDATDVIVKEGYQEASNVKLVEELVNMVLVSRMYEANMKLVGAKKDSSGTAISVAMG